LQRQGISARLIATEAAGTAGFQARQEIEAGCDLIIAAGGDGTINEVANGMLGTAVPMGILPGGTANVLARELRIPVHLESAAAQFSQWIPVPVPVGSIQLPGSTPRSFVCMAGVGLDAEIVSRVNADLKARAGKLAYYISGFSHFLDPLREFDVLVDGRRYRSSFALISRVRNYGGDLEIARHASLLRDDFEVVLFQGRERIRYIPYLVGVAVKQAHRLPGVTVLHGSHIRCESPSESPVYVQVDGELAGELPVSTQIMPAALTMLLPPQFVAREQRYVTTEPVYA
jgi:YegS/Rv2252/BmrU family lipid kinase